MSARPCLFFLTSFANTTSSAFTKSRTRSLAPSSSLSILAIKSLRSLLLIFKKSFASRSDLLAKDFLKMRSKERSDLIAKMLKDEEGAKERVRDFVNALEVVLAKDVKKNKQGLADIAIVRDYLGDRAPSMKMLLEHLALSLPSF